VDYRALKLDLSSQKAIREAASEVLSWIDIPTIDILVNNAAVMNLPERTLTEDGLEMQFATNHIGHFLFTCLIMSKLIKAAEKSSKGATRIINVSSLSPTVAGMRWSDINFEKINKTLPAAEQPSYDMHRTWGAVDPEEKSYLPLEGYNQSKVANVLFGIAANKRLYEKYGILSLALHPGIIQTELSRYAAPETIKAIGEFLKSGKVYRKTLGAGTATTIVAATDPGLGMPESKGKDGKENWGAYLIDCQISGLADARAVSSIEAEKLWKLSEELVKEKFAW
jgi:NAD(P)-dependent dehydrogenase (short-subunit alcohol dehydrogenase family)